MKGRVKAIGGVFFRSKDPEQSKAWYKKHLGIQTGKYGSSFGWRHFDEPDRKGFTAWNPFTKDSDYFGSLDQEFMVNYRVDDLEAMLLRLKREGITIAGEIQSFEYGKFAHILDFDGNKVELWEPNDEAYEKLGEDLSY